MSRPRRIRHTTETTKLIRVSPEETGLRPHEARGSLVVLQGPEADIGLHRWLHGTVVLGRDPLADMPLDDVRISRHHCAVNFEGERYYVEDLDSTNGTKLNATKLKPGRRVELKPNDRITLGSCVVKFALTGEVELDYHAQMDALVGTDDLTGLIVKRRFDADFARSFEAAVSERAPLALLMLDMDGLKQINDTHGHPMGAFAIATVGRIIGAVVSSHGAACRLGGDEFAAFLRGQPKSVGMAFGESIRRWVHENHFEKDGVVIRPTISIGVAAFPDDAATGEDLCKRADEALYRAKRAGRDRVAV